MKTKAIVATLLIAAAASADARFAWPKSSITGRDRSLGCDKRQCVVARREVRTHHGESVRWRTGRSKIIANQEGKGSAQDWSVSFCVAGISPLFTGFQRPSSLTKQKRLIRSCYPQHRWGSEAVALSE